MRKHSIGFLMPIMLACFGVVFLLIGCSVYTNKTEAKRNGVETSAVIVDIIRGDTQEDHTEVIVRFEVNGRTYTGELDHWSSFMRIGDKETIYYDPNNPADFVGDVSSIVYVAIIIVSAVMAFVGVRMLLKQAKARIALKSLKENGIKITAAVKEVEIDHSIMINGVYARRLVCEVELPDNTATRCYRSGIFTDEIRNAKGLLVDIYIDKDNPDNYFVDTESITG